MEAANSENNLVNKTVNRLCVGENGSKLCFHIPSYQRGYRWTSHVTKLMDDIFIFDEERKKGLNVGQYYCLQPIVVRHRPDLDIPSGDGQSEICYEVVDGQQRLTTIYILLIVLGHHPEDDGIFRISYERDGNHSGERENFLQSITANVDGKTEKADFFFIRTAYKNAKDWLHEKTEKIGENPRVRLLNILINDVQVIWYKLPNDADVRSHFRNINAGKIQLTNSELVKAMMLNSRHYQVKDIDNVSNTVVRSLNDAIRLKQQRIARVWDDCEHAFRNNAFWGFITCDDRPLSKRMDFLLELYYRRLISSKNENIENHENRVSTFFEDILTNKDEVSRRWDEIRELFRMIQDWHGNIHLYNYIGLLIQYRGASRSKRDTLLDLSKEYVKYSTSDFHNWIKETIQTDIGIPRDEDEFSQLNYNDQKQLVKWTLTLFNIKLMNRMCRRFDFSVMGGWSVEHVFAQQSVKIKEAERKKWVHRHLRVVESALKLCDDETKYEEIIKLKERMTGYDAAADFEELFGHYLKLIETPEGDMHTIGNLTLLGRDDNSALGNDSFFDKRRKIIEMGEMKHNVPIGTERVFLKSFPGISTGLDYWSKTDGSQYIEYMRDVIFGKQGE